MITQTKTHLRIWLVLLVVFVLGGAAGVALDRAFYLRFGPAHREGENKQRFLQTMQSELQLSDNQTAEITRIIQETREEFRALKTDVRPRYEAVKQKKRERIRAILSAEQQQRFDALITRMQAEREKK